MLPSIQEPDQFHLLLYCTINTPLRPKEGVLSYFPPPLCSESGRNVSSETESLKLQLSNHPKASCSTVAVISTVNMLHKLRLQHFTEVVAGK